MDIGKWRHHPCSCPRAAGVIAEGGGRFNATSQIKEGDLIVHRWYSGGGHVEYCCETGGTPSSDSGAPTVSGGPAYWHAIVLFWRVPVEAEALCLRSSTTTRSTVPSRNAVVQHGHGRPGRRRPTGAKEVRSKRAVERGEEFIYLRRYKTELKTWRQLHRRRGARVPEQEFEVRSGAVLPLAQQGRG